MRPLRLAIKGFTSFRDGQEIDFTDLDLFALWGPTGSGKSSVLDAMTYALYGKVDRVDHASALVSQGQPRMSVTLDFRADRRDYRVTRSTVAGGSSKALLEKLDESDTWVSLGPGADKVRDVNKLLVHIVGLDYPAFTRSVLLPQGKFAEFLVGEASDRRKILIELLGLELFDQMAKYSNEIAREEKLSGDTKQNLVDRSFAGVDQPALTKARSQLEMLGKQVEALAAAEKRLTELVGRCIELEASANAVVACRKEIEGFTGSFQASARALDDLARLNGGFGAELEAAKGAESGAAKALASAHKDKSDAEGRWGSLDRLASLIVRAENLTEAAAALERARQSLTDARGAEKQSLVRTDEAANELETAERRSSDAASELARCTTKHDEAHRKDRIGSLVHGLGAGAPCPVCERPLQTIPSFDPSALDSTAAGLESARSSHDRAQDALNRAKTTLAVAKKEHGAAGERVEQCDRVVADTGARHGAITVELADAFGKKVPADPARELTERSRVLRGLIDTSTEVEAAHSKARETLSSLEERHRQLAAEVAKIRTQMESNNVAAALDRVALAAVEVERADLDALESLPTGAEALVGEAEQIAKVLASLESDLDESLRQRRSGIETLRTEMRASLPDGLEIRGENPTSLLEGVRKIHNKINADEAVADKEAAALEHKLDERTTLEDEIASHREQQHAYADLQKELKADRIVQFLQAEALVVLAAAATQHLHELSGSRYRLIYDEDRFFVVDAWNGDERRNVKTLSGGETFLTSLALALALSDQIQLLSVTEKSRLESLFLDEGFGQLDNEALEVVVDAIEQMRGADRLVGVITHVSELAERMPVRLEVSKSPRGSTIRRAVEVDPTSGRSAT